MKFLDSVQSVYGKYFQFSGRASRSEYWWFVLFYILANIVTSLLDNALFPPSNPDGPTLLNALFALVSIIPSLSVTSRRLHDVDRSGWWQLLGIIPIVGWIIMIYWLAQKGTSGPNRFGEEPQA